MKNSILLFFFLVPVFLFAQYPTTGNKSRLGWQTTGDGLIWRGVAGDTVNKPNNRNYPYFQLDTVNAVLYRYIATQGNWQAVGGGSIDIDSLIYATRFWVNSNFFPLQGGLLTGTAGNGFVGFPLQSSPPATPSTGFSLFAGSTGNNISWMQPDGFFRRLVSPVTGTPRQYQFMARSYTLADSADVAALPTGTGTTNYYAKWSSANALTIGNLFDNNTAVSILNSKPFLLGQWTTAGRPSGTTGYEGYNTTGNGKEWYNGTRWAYTLESTFARGTANYVPFFDANGQVSENINFQLTTTTTPKLIVPNGNSTIRGIEFYNSDVGGGTSGFRQTNNVISIIGNNANKLDIGNAVVNFTATNALFQLNSRTILSEPTSTALWVGQGYRAVFLDPIASGGTPRVLMFGTSNSANTKFGLVGATGFLALNMGATDARYQMETISTNAWGFPRGTVAQRPTITINTSPMRFNTDSTSFEYGESVGTWRLFATREYARSLVSALSPDTWLGTRLVAGNVKISTTNSLTFKQGTTRWTTSTEALGTSITSGSVTFRKTSAGDFGGTIAFGDTIARDNVFYFLQDDRSITQNYGTGRQLVVVAENTSLPGTYRWAFGARVDTSTTSLSTLRVMLGDRYASSTVPVTVSVNAGVQPSESVANAAVTITVLGDAGKKAFTVNDAITTRMNGKVYFGLDSTLSFDPSTDLLRLSQYGTLAKTSAALFKTGTNINATYATDGTLLEIERKRDTTVYIDDADYDWSAAITTAQIASRFNRVIFWMTTTAAAGSDSDITLHTPDANLMQVEYLIHSVDEAGGFSNKIVFGTNNAVDSTNGLVTNYYPAAGDGIHIRAGLRSGVYKYRYSN